MDIQKTPRDSASVLALQPSDSLSKSEYVSDLTPHMLPGRKRVKLKCSHLSENCLLNLDESCESKVVRKFGK